jgi:hypothetical protein
MSGAEIDGGRRVVERWNEVFRALSAEPRRQLIVALLDVTAGEPVPLPESAINPNVPVDEPHLRSELRHCHLPMLADCGYVEWHRDPLEAVRGRRFEEVAVVFDALYASAPTIPDPLVFGCQRLESERAARLDG